ncbi:MAG: ArnT family glycosyltransferase [Janthinobacterium lividum]
MTETYSRLKVLLRNERLVAWSLLGLLLVVGLFILPDFGISTDEPQQRRIGQVSLKYICGMFFPHFLDVHPELKDVWNLHEFWDRDYGVAFELPLAWLELIFGIKEWRNIFLFRHVCTFLVSLGGVVAVYQLARRRFGDWRIGLLGAAMLVLTPRIFGEMFYNNKDIIFMTTFAIAINSAVLFVQRPTWWRALGHALACTIAIDVRIMGILVPLATGAFLVLQLARGAYKGQRQVYGQIALYLGIIPILVVAFWPFLWESPARNFVLGFQNMSKFRWDGLILYAGDLVWGHDLPWHYAEGWIGVTTPLLFLLGFFVGAFLILRQLVRRHWRLYATTEEWQDLLFLGLLLAPLLAVIVLHSVLYNAWRQLYFVYPPLLLVALRGLVALGSWRPSLGQWQRVWPRLCYTALIGTFLASAVQIVTLHPLQTTYFNALAGRHIEGRFEIDYWVLSYQEGLQWIALHDNRPHIIVSAQRTPELESMIKMLPPYDRDRFQAVPDAANAEYFITTYYDHYYEYTQFAYELATVRRGGQRILSIFRTKW